MAILGQPIDWSCYFSNVALPAADFRSECVSRLSKALIYRKRWKLDEMFLKNTDMKPRLTYPLVKLILLNGDTYRRFPLTI
jgi:hypothetical protein